MSRRAVLRVDIKENHSLEVEVHTHDVLLAESVLYHLLSTVTVFGAVQKAVLFLNHFVSRNRRVADHFRTSILISHVGAWVG